MILAPKTITISSRDQMTIPPKLYRALGWQKGDRLTVSIMDDESFKVTRLKTKETTSL